VYRKSLKSWYTAFLKRMKKRHGVDLCAHATQQQSVGRAMVTESTITEFKDALLAKFESAELALNDVGNGDEWRFDFNQVVRAKTLGTSGCRTTGKKSRLRS